MRLHVLIDLPYVQPGTRNYTSQDPVQAIVNMIQQQCWNVGVGGSVAGWYFEKEGSSS